MTDPGEKISGKTILIAPLDWGLGHSSRCVALVKKLIARNRIIIGTTPVNKLLFDFYFPAAEQVELPSYNIRYSRFLPQWAYILFKLPRILFTVRREKAVVGKLLLEKQIDLVISDNRYGARASGIPSFMICHQLNVPLPLLSRLTSRLHQRYLKKFTATWIPDYPDHRLSGKLSRIASSSSGKQNKLKTEFLGPLSALRDGGEKETDQFKFLVLLSGPEPQRTLLEGELLTAFAVVKKKVALVRGTTKLFSKDPPENVLVLNFVAGNQLRSLILNSETVICRSGYSTLMDMHVLGKKKLILIPTPGQPEQQYLALHWQRNFGATVVNQNEIERFGFGA